MEYYQAKKIGKKLKNEEEKNRLSVELCYNHQFHRSDSSILDHFAMKKFFKNIHSIERYQTKFIAGWL